ncbi:MAG: DNA-binding domain-containing protein [Dongiaceae bacterium]
MTSLARLQQDFADFLHDRPSDIRAQVTGGPNAGLDTLLGIYRNAYTVRLVGILRDEFATLRALVGDRAFDRIARAYLAAHPSTYFSVRWIGIGLADYLATADPWRADMSLAQIAQIEWAQTMAFDAADRPLVSRADLAVVPPTGWPGLILTLHPSVQILSVSPDLFAIWNRIAQGEPADAKPATVAARAPHLVWRIGLDVKLRPIEPDEAAALDAVATGQTFADICELLAGHVGPDRAAMRAATLLERWVSTDMIGRVEFPTDMSS